ncbi:MAG TPA: hypothetical protein VFA07_18145 [Chthonomonadaceae bacterium]|nr:hypothetical protein [Chthonomonadaceae bacterium]
MRLTPGQVLYLPADLPGIPAGPWVLIQLDRQITLNRLGEDEDGRLCLQWRRVQVTPQQMRWFAPVAVRLPIRQEVDDRLPLSVCL